jgi:tetratricopeptide (TPR) repeat protein
MREFPDRADVKARMGQCLYLTGRFSEARRLLEEARREMPDDPRILIHLAKIDVEQEDPPPEPTQAEDLLRHALKVDPWDIEALHTLNVALRLQKRDEEADKVLAEFDYKRKLLKRANDLLAHEAKYPTNNPAKACEIGEMLLEMGQDTAALSWIDKALTVNRDFAPAHEILEKYYTKKGDRDRALVHRRVLDRLKKKP